MTELDVYKPPPPVEVPTPAANDFDSWIAVAGQVVKLAREICDTPFVPDGLRGSAPATAAAILAGREMGLGPMTALQHIHVIKGKPGQSALLMRALIVAAGHQWDDVDISDTRAVVRGRRKGESGWTEASFTAVQAKQAGIDLGKYPQDKLYARATTRLARRKFADVIMGMPYAAEELEDGEVIEETITAGTTPAIEPAKPAPAPARTARRRQPATAAPAGQPAPAATQQQGADTTGLPPLPGEDEDPTTSAASSSADAPDNTSQQKTAEPSPNTPDGSATAPANPKLVGVIVQHFERLGYDDSEREQRLQAIGVLIGHDIESAKDLTQAEAVAVANTLSRCKDRSRLIELLVAAEKPDGGTDG